MFNKEDFDISVRSQDDFYKYANGGWLNATTIPSDQAAWGSFNVLHVQNQERLRGLLEDLETNHTDSHNFKKLKQFYSVAMDESVVESSGLSGIADVLHRLDTLQTKDALSSILAWLHRHGFKPFWQLIIDIDDKDSNLFVMRLHQGGLGMPDKEYYLSGKEDMADARAEYMLHLARTFTLLGKNAEDSRKAAQQVFDLEMQLAKVSWERVKLRDVDAMYNPTTVEELAANSKLGLLKYFEGIGLKNESRVMNSQPDYFAHVLELISETPVEMLRAYITYHFISPLMPALPHAFVEERFSFFGKVITGTKELMPRWRRVLQTMNLYLEEPLGELYVSKYFSPDQKQVVEQIADDVFTAFRNRLQENSWMSEQTKLSAFAKLTSMKRKFGYPDVFRDFSELQLTDNYAANVLAAAAFDYAHKLDKLAYPVDKTEWHCGAHVVNAFYWANYNDISFPAGVLQWPFFDPNNDMAENYGAIGAIIGHELTHGFDDKGSKFDADGNLRVWWSGEDREKFEAMAKRYVEQFNACKISEDLFVNGSLTIGENIADLGGLCVAFNAYKLYAARTVSEEVIDGFTPKQRIFLGFARQWRMLIRPELEVMYATVDTHSPARFRVNVPISNFESFYDAFALAPGDALFRNKEDWVIIW